MKLFFTFFTIIMYVINEILILKNESNIKNDENEKNEFKKIKRWEIFSNFAIMVLFLTIIIFLVIKFNWLAIGYNIIYYGGCALIYSFILINILLKNKEEKISSYELRALMLIPLLIVSVYDIFGKELQVLTSGTIEMFIIKNIIKYFIGIFFIFMDIFIFLMQIKQFLELKNKNKQKVEKDEIKFNIIDFEYINAKGKKGIYFLKGYIKDIKRLLLNIIKAGLYNVGNVFLFIFIISKKFIKKITGNFSMYVIVLKTFNISLIISLLLTYNKVLINYQISNNTTEMYSIIITVIIIPNIMEIINELKK